MRHKGKDTIPFPMQISLILLCGVLMSILAAIVVRGKLSADAVAANETPVYQVTFALQDGTVIEVKSVHEGKGVMPPEYSVDGVFRGWSTPFNSVTSNVETHPMIYQVADENLFCFDSVYVKEGEQFTIRLNLVGTVNISSADLSIEYDPMVMDYVASKNAACCVIHEVESGSLRMELRSERPVNEAMLLSEITFFAKQEDVYSTQINLRCTNGILKTGATETTTAVSTLNNKIYYLQEVE